MNQMRRREGERRESQRRGRAWRRDGTRGGGSGLAPIGGLTMVDPNPNPNLTLTLVLQWSTSCGTHRAAHGPCA